MTHWLKSPWFVALAGALIYWGTTALLIRPSQFAGVRAALAAATLTPDDDPSWRFRNPEFEQWVAELKMERTQLATRAQQLQDWQTRLETQRQEFSTATQTVSQLQSEFDQDVVRIKAQQVANLKQQAKIIAAMSPDAAASLVGQMSDDDVVRLLSVMKTDQASALLDALSKQGADGVKRAAQLTERLRMVLPPAAGPASP